MADESIRRSGRATKGQHTKTSSSPAPNPKGAKPAKGAASKKKGTATASQATSEAGDDDDETIRCICGNDNPKDKRAFIGCDACSVWQHNVCMGMPDDDDEVGEHYFCEQCRPEEHEETLQALEKGEKIWDTRNKIWQAEKKMSKNRKARSGGKGGWLKKNVVKAEETEVESQEAPPADDTQEAVSAPRKSESVEAAPKDAGIKRKRESEVPASEPAVQEEPASEPPKEQKKRRKSSSAPKKATEDPETALVPIDQLPSDRKKIAQALSKTTADGVKEQVASNGFRIPDGQTPKSLGDHHASRIEYALAMNYEGTQNADYAKQFRMISANLKQNKTLLQELLAGSLTADELALMESSEMASDELQKQRAEMKAEADRQATIDQKETGVRYRRTHKGDELVEDENATTSAAPVSRPVRHSISEAEIADSAAQGPGSPGTTGGQPTQTPLGVDTSRPAPAGPDRRSSSQQNFNVDKIWAHTAQSPTQASAPRLPRKQSSVQQQPGGAKVDADVDRMLAEGDDESYSPADAAGLGSAVWRGKIAQASGESSPTVNARYVAGRDVSSTISWKDLLPPTLNIDGRLMIAKAEEYLCGLQWSVTSDVSVLALTPHDDIAAFNTVFEYFTSRGRYAVVNKDRPALVKDLYLIPLEVGSKLPDHVEMLDYCELKPPIEERVIIATFVLARHTPEGSPTPSKPAAALPTPDHTNGNGNGQAPVQHLPDHLRQGPQGSPLQQSGPHFSPAQQNFGPGSPMPPNPYTAQPPPQHGTPPAYQNPAYAQPPSAAPAPPYNHLAAQVLGEFYNAPTASLVLMADPGITREKLENLRTIFEDDEMCRTDMRALQGKLGL